MAEHFDAMQGADPESALDIAFEHLPLISLSEYGRPSLPAEENLRLLWARAKALVRQAEEKPHIESEQLEKTTMGLLDKVVAPPACGPLMEEIELSVAAWCSGDPIPANMLIVMPPCDENDVLTQWAKDHNHQILPSPTRQAITSPIITPIPVLDGEGLLVIPRLEDWFLRHRSGHAPIRELLAQLDATPRRCVIGCNSWAWAYLQKAVEADLILTQAQIFRPFDDKRLHNWLDAMANGSARRTITFRQSKSGKDILRLDEGGKPESDFLKTLAARSLGIPWVAWHMWRRALRSDREDAEEMKADVEEIHVPMESSEIAAAKAANTATATPLNNLANRRKFTLWVAEVEELNLPIRQLQDALLVLHALLIHGNLTVEELRAAVPLVGGSYIVAQLVSKGFVTRDKDVMRVHPAAYPQVRSALGSAGFPVAAI